MRKIFVALTLMVSAAMSAQNIDGRNFSIDGFAAYEGTPGTNHYRQGGTTGDQGGKTVYAANFSQLQAYLQSTEPYTVIVDRDITTGITAYVESLATGKLCDKQDGTEGEATTYGERIMIAPNKTLIGVVNPETGLAPLFSRITFVMQCPDNVIIRNCRFTMNGVPVLRTGENKIVAWRDGKTADVGDPDCISLQADKESAKKDWGAHVWIDHCEFFNGNASNKDRYDGLLDCKNNVQWLTFSYNYFHNHDKSCLFGKGDSDIYDDCRTISFHHNFFENIEGSRLPLQRGGHVHYYNNYQKGCADGWRLYTQATGYMEACYFENSKAPVIFKQSGNYININEEEGYKTVFKSCSQVLAGFTNIDGMKSKELPVMGTTTWTPTQTASTYTVNQLDRTEDVPAIAQKYAGAGKIDIVSSYTDVIPAENAAEYSHAVATQHEGLKVYDLSGNVVTGIGNARAAYASASAALYTLSGTRTTAGTHGVVISRTVDAQGVAHVCKVVR